MLEKIKKIINNRFPKPISNLQELVDYCKVTMNLNDSLITIILLEYYFDHKNEVDGFYDEKYIISHYFKPNIKSSNLLIPYFLNGKLNIRDYNGDFYNKLFEKMFTYSSDNDFLDLLVNNGHPFELITLIKMLLTNKNLVNNSSFIALIKSYAGLTDTYKLFDDINFLIEKNYYTKLPNIIIDIFKKEISTLDFNEQVKGYYQLNRRLIDIFDELSNKNYFIVGSNHHQRYVIKSKENRLYGFVDMEGNIIVPPIFSEVSNYRYHNGNVYALGHITYDVAKASKLEKGFYKIFHDGKYELTESSF